MTITDKTSEIERFEIWRSRLLKEHKDEPEWQEEVDAFFVDLYRQTYPARTFPLLMELWDRYQEKGKKKTMNLREKLTDMKASIDRYIEHACPTGSFLQAVLENDLREAMGRADEGSRVILFDIVCYLHQDCPGGCWGSPEKVREWFSMDTDDRLRLVAASSFGDRRGIRAPVEKESGA